MSSICNRCTLRLQRAANLAEAPATSTRAFSTSASRRKDHHVPSFNTSNPDLSNTLNQFRDKHFVPSLLSKSQRKLIFGTKNQQTLAENPQSVNLAGDEFPLQWIDRRTEVPNRLKLLHTAIDQMSETGGEAWNNLPGLLMGLKQCNSPPKPHVVEKIVRRAIQADRIGVLILCLQQSEKIGFVLSQPEVLNQMIQGLHDRAQRCQWSKSATARSLKQAQTIASLLESSVHGMGRYLRPDDPRRAPEVVAVFLELAAVYSLKHQGASDVDGKVRAYTERLLACLEAHPEKMQPASKAPPAKGPVWEMLHGVPLWHGLMLARRILGEQGMPKRDLASRVEADYKAGLENLAAALEGRQPDEGSYGEQALRYWRDCERE
ncbi:hypothetical protein MBLNU230_g0474t1 [Neophaeotheca triangularis]